MKKIISLALSFVLLISTMSAFSMSVGAASYADELKSKGFPDSYVSKLVALHEKYPNWEFKPFKTGLDWSAAVKGERQNHASQLIEKQSSLSNDYYCSCSSCYKNGSYVIQESSRMVSASEKAVKLYMDPRNWLTEKYIFQFESTDYNTSQKQADVEAIISSTWMHNANITYVNAEGKTVTYKDSNGNTMKYSAAIMAAAKNSGMSAYYLASRIVQEVGGSKPTANGVSGVKSPFKGIFNYYSIGAYSNASQGLEWASGYLKTTQSTTLFSSYDSSTKKGSGTKTSIGNGQYMSYMGTYGDYYKVTLYYVSGSSYTAGKTGYVLKSALRTTYFNYGRPWNNPYKSIYNGATYIYNSYSKYQNTQYLHKFNVNKDSGSLYNHEYMAAVQAPYLESTLIYKAYNNAGILSTKKIFYIPVFNNMPSSPCTVDGTSPSSSSTTTTTTATPKVTGLKVTTRATTSLGLSWTKVSGASKYYIYIKNNTKGSTFNKTVTTNTATLNGLTAGNNYSVKVKAYKSSSWGAYSSTVTSPCKPAKVKLNSVTSPSTTKIKASWSKVSGSATGYQIYYGKDKDFKTLAAKKFVSGQSTVTYTGKNFTKGKTYYIKVRAYKTVNDKKYYGAWSNTIKVKCK